ncbi:MAG: selenocysteine-specific translation elongation factor [candidate division KSB1 bacterium]|nr:selenocysteine-specific translation elongation factor [candidate division KSB1 bacterium]
MSSDASPRRAIIGTAGHVDHGKSSLVKALTGTDPDRLKEEKERGLTIDLGFAYLSDKAAIIDVPGHERFIKNMVAGVSTIDLVLFVVAADDGVMPQTREHLEILDLLRVRRGIIVLNKIDLVEREWLELVEGEVRELVRGTFLESAPIVRVSAVTGEGIDALRQEIDRAMEELPERADRGLFFMPIDRAFVLRGFGTVVTGSVLSGRVRVGDRLEIQPKGLEVRVRSIQRHGKPVERVGVAERAGINLLGVEKEVIERGDVLVEPGYYVPTDRLHVSFRLLPSAPRPLQQLARVRLHLGTGEYLCRVRLLGREQVLPGEECLAELRLEEKVVSQWGAPFVVRSYSPLVTIGGGVILDLYPARFDRKETGTVAFLSEQASLDLERAVAARIRRAGRQPVELRTLAQQLTTHPDQLQAVVDGLVRKGTVVRIKRGGRDGFVHQEALQEVESLLLEVVRRYHADQPLREGMNRSEAQESLPGQVDISLFEAAVERLVQAGLLVQQGGLLRLPEHTVRLTPEEEELRRRVLHELEEGGYSPPSVPDMAARLAVPVSRLTNLLGALEAKGEVVRIEADLYLEMGRVRQAQELLRQYCTERGEITVSEFRELLGTTRRYALGLLLRFDEMGVTERVGDVRRLAGQAGS